jgi:transcriptional regulator with XRE-family HTH domain
VALRELKNRTPHSFESLAMRTGVSRSALHRYCTGASLPADFGPVERFARHCGATRAELIELHRLWVQAGVVAAGPPPATDLLPRVPPATSAPSAPARPIWQQPDARAALMAGAVLVAGAAFSSWARRPRPGRVA